MTDYRCPACGCATIVTIEDFERDLQLFRCDGCGEMYAARQDDIAELGFAAVMDEWRGCYESQGRLTQ